MRDKVHLKGFRFEKQSRAFSILQAGDADIVYGDSFRREGRSIKDIGNNVSLLFEEMDFGEAEKCSLMIRGKTKLQTNSITVKIQNDYGEETNEVLDFHGNGAEEQCFSVRVPGGVCSVTFVFLPGSVFDFTSFRFMK